MSVGKSSKYLFLQILIVIGLGVYYALGLGYFGIFEQPGESQTIFYFYIFAGVTVWLGLASILVKRTIQNKLKLLVLSLGLVLAFALIVGTVIGLAGLYTFPGFTSELFTNTLSHLALLSLIPLAAGLILWNGFGNNSQRSEQGTQIGQVEGSKTGVKRVPPKKLKLDIGQGKQLFEVLLTDLILVEAADNYCKIYFLKNEVPQTEMIRVKLKEVEDRLNGEGFFFRCHRSYLVNGHFVESIAGTSQNYRLHLGQDLDPVKVSRHFDLAPIRLLMAE